MIVVNVVDIQVVRLEKSALCYGIDFYLPLVAAH